MLYDEYVDAVLKYKSMYGDRVLVVFEVGSFYEWYNCDKNEGCDVQGLCELLNIAKTRKDKTVPEVSRKNPEFAGVPNYAFPKFVPLLLEHGYTVIVYTQKQNENGQIFRALEYVLSRGTCLDIPGARDGRGETSDGNSTGGGKFVACLFLDSHTHRVDSVTNRKAEILHCGCSLVDVTSGVSVAHEINSCSDDPGFALDEIHRIVREYQPLETVIYGKRAAVLEECDSENVDSDAADREALYRTRLAAFLRRVSLDSSAGVFDRLDSADSRRIASIKFQESTLRRVFTHAQTGFLSAVEALDMETTPHACASFAGLLQFVFEHNEHALANILRPEVVTAWDGQHEYTNENKVRGDPESDNARALLNYNAAEQLDVISRASTATSSAVSLCLVLNGCVTSMGRRYFAHQLLHPLVNAAHIRRRLDEVRLFCGGEKGDDGDLYVDSEQRLADVRRAVKRVGDLERVFRRVALRKLAPTEFSSIDASLHALRRCLEAPASGRLYRDLDLVRETCRLVEAVRGAYAGVIRIWAADDSDGDNNRRYFEKTTSENGKNEDEDDNKSASSAETEASSSFPFRNDGGEAFDPCDSVFCENVFPDIDEIARGLSRYRARMKRLVDAFNAALMTTTKTSNGVNKPMNKNKPFFRIDSATAFSSSSSAPASYVITATQLRCSALRRLLRGSADDEDQTDKDEGRKKKDANNKKKGCRSDSTAVSLRHPPAVWWPGTEDEFDCSLFATRPLNSSASCLVHPVLEDLDARIREAEAAVRSMVDERYDRFLRQLWESHGSCMTTLARRVCHLDYVSTCAANARRYRHVPPRVMDPCSEKTATRSHISATQLRHPILEIIHDRTPHVSNDVRVGDDVQDGSKPPSLGVLVYGMNAAGKSCLMKAVALAAIMAQAGMFVAASDVELLPFSKFFTRIQTHDDLARGQSTFMVEVAELRNILKRCDARSLVIGDEICSGTESVSALAIVGSSVRRLLDRGVPFLFATHLHELPRALHSIGTDTSRLRVCHLRVDYDPRTGRLVYNRKLQNGQGPTVYGLEVCRALDMDPEFVDAAHRIRKSMLAERSGGDTTLGASRASRYNARVLVDACGVCGKERADEVHHIRFQSEADEAGLIDGKFHKNAAFNLIPLCRECHDLVHHGKLHVHGFSQTSEGIVLSFDKT